MLSVLAVLVFLIVIVGVACPEDVGGWLGRIHKAYKKEMES